jgi:hypothetical protein
MRFEHGYQAGRVVGEHYLDYLIGFQIGFWIGVPLAIMKQMYSQPTLVNHTGHRNPAGAITQSGYPAMNEPK